MSKLNEFIKPRVHNILFDAGYNPITLAREEFKRTVYTPGEWVEYQNYYVNLNKDEWWYQKPQRGNLDDIFVCGDYSPEGLDKLRQTVKIDPKESE